MWSEVESVGVRALQSLKIRTALVGAIAMLIVRLFHVGSDQANEIASGILQITMVLVGAQGLADFGKVGITQASVAAAQTAVAKVTATPQPTPPAGA